jgi:hypothetical protein
MKKITTVLNSEKTTLFLSPILLVYFIIAFSFQSFSQNCNSTMKVSQDRDMQSAILGMPAKFDIELTNNSASVQTYNIESAASTKAFKVEGESPVMLNNNYKLNSKILLNGFETTSISVPAHSTITFKTVVALPDGTPINKWGVIELKARNKSCTDGTVSTFLKVFARDPSEN